MKPLLAIILSLAWTLSAAQAEDAFIGTWKITDAKALNGHAYTGRVDLRTSGTVYEARWDTSVGKYLGTGLADGKQLCVAYGPAGYGVVLYKIGADGTLDGRWTTAGSTGEGTEKATGGKPGELAGEYTIKGANPGGGGGYGGKLSIQQEGNVYHLTWTIPGSISYNGVGLRSGNLLHVGWSTAKGVYGVVAYTLDGTTANGIWTVGGAKATATENLAR